MDQARYEPWAKDVIKSLKESDYPSVLRELSQFKDKSLPAGKVTMSEAMAASERIWQASVQNGTDTMTMDEIDAEIAAARKERKARAGA
jgi:hypothetical protein